MAEEKGRPGDTREKSTGTSRAQQASSGRRSAVSIERNSPLGAELAPPLLAGTAGCSKDRCREIAAAGLWAGCFFLFYGSVLAACQALTDGAAERAGRNPRSGWTR